MRIIGMMSGTSVDGIDVVVAEITEQPVDLAADRVDKHPVAAPLQIAQIAFATAPWDAAIRRQIFALIQQPTTAAALCEANFLLAEQFALAADNVLHAAGIAWSAIDLIASHGQTIWHNVVDGQVTSTLQIGDPAVIAARTGVTTVGNFRTADVAVGGQGAPLVSLYDWIFLRPTGAATSGWRAVQNIGGIGNVTFLPPYGNAQVPLAFDTGPGNVFIDWAAAMTTAGQQTFDHNGQLAAAGQPALPLLDEWLKLPYFAQKPPKSTGRELFDHALVTQWWTVAQQEQLRAVDFVATMTELTAASIAEAYARFAPGPIAEVVVGGGGARNPILLERLRQQLAHKLQRTVPVYTHADLGIDDKAKEALAFALMGYLTVHGQPGNVPACTGAREPQILGQIAPGRNFRQVQLSR